MKAHSYIVPLGLRNGDLLPYTDSLKRLELDMPYILAYLSLLFSLYSLVYRGRDHVKNGISVMDTVRSNRRGSPE